VLTVGSDGQFSERPSAAELAAIELEMPLIRAEVDLVGAEIRVLTAEPHPSELDWRRLRAAERRVSREMVAFVATARRLLGSDQAA